jgi:hypothetical protein
MYLNKLRTSLVSEYSFTNKTAFGDFCSLHPFRTREFTVYISVHFTMFTSVHYTAYTSCLGWAYFSPARRGKLAPIRCSYSSS